MNEVSTTTLMIWLHKLVESAHNQGRELEVLAALAAVVTKGYVKSLGTDQAAMIFYNIADSLATDTLNDDEDERGDDRQ